jgi:hypothetical protein
MGEMVMEQGFIPIFEPFGPTMITLLIGLFQAFAVLSSVLIVIAFIVGIVVLDRSKKERERMDEAERMKQMFHHWRHHWMNHVQVMMGYLSLQKPERIQPYLQQLMQEAEQERVILEMKYAPLAIALLTLSDRYPQWKVQVEVGSNFALPEEEERNLFQIIEIVFPWLEKQATDVADWNQMEVNVEQQSEKVLLGIQIFRVDGHLVYFDFPVHQWEELRHSIRKWNGQVAVNGKEGLQVIFPLRSDTYRGV